MYLQQFPSYFNRKRQRSPFSRTAAHIFVYPGDAPAIITQYVAWMERQFNACQTPRSMYSSIFNSFWVIRCLSQCVSPKIAIFTTVFVFPGDAPGAITLNVVWVEREFDAYKLSRCVFPSNYNHFWDRARYWSKIVIFRSTSESRPNSIEGKNVRPPVRTSVRPSVHKKFLQFEWNLVYR